MCIKGAKKIYFGVFKTEKSKTGICVGCGSGKDTHCGLGNIQRSLAWFLQKGRGREKERPQKEKERERERERNWDLLQASGSYNYEVWEIPRSAVDKLYGYPEELWYKFHSESQYKGRSRPMSQISGQPVDQLSWDIKLSHCWIFC